MSKFLSAVKKYRIFHTDSEVELISVCGSRKVSYLELSLRGYETLRSNN